ncbi:MAG TPA: hypothetical protein VE912_05525 [Bacteroidales bacterium]|nr:hypothetical protein [Bacteroidales bacterium]
MNQEKKNLIMILVVLLLAGISPNLFPIAQAGLAKLSSLAIVFLIPSFILILVLMIFAGVMKYDHLGKQISNGILAGLAATVGLELIREIGFRMGWMPGDMPKLLGVLLLNRFASGPDFWSNVAGWTYHFWNGATFGIIFSLIFGQGKMKIALVYAFLIGTVFMISPAAKALGVGVLGLQFKDGYQFLTTVYLAHIAFGIILGWLTIKLNKDMPDIVNRVKVAFSS